MDGRIAKLESDVSHIGETLKDIKSDLREIRADIGKMRDRIDGDFRITWGGLIIGILGLAALVAKALKWVS